MGNVQSDVNDIQQNFMTNITDQSQQNCLNKDLGSASGNMVIVSGTRINGNFTGVAEKVGSTADCIITSNMETTVTSLLKAVTQQDNSAKTDVMNDGVLSNVNTNVYNLSQTVSNNINNINNAACSSQTISNADNNYIYVSSSFVGGNFVGVTNESDANSTCSLANVMKATAFNQMKASTTQTNSVTGMFAGILGGIFFLIICIIVVVLIATVVKAASGSGANKKEQQQNQQTQQQILQLEELQATRRPPGMYRPPPPYPGYSPYGPGGPMMFQ